MGRSAKKTGFADSGALPSLEARVEALELMMLMVMNRAAPTPAEARDLMAELRELAAALRERRADPDVTDIVDGRVAGIDWRLNHAPDERH